MSKKPKLLTISQAARAMGISVFSLRRKVRSGAIKVKKVRKAGRGIRWLVDVPHNLRKPDPTLVNRGDVQWVLAQEKDGSWFWLKRISPNFVTIPIPIRIQISIPVEEECVTSLLADPDFMPRASEADRRIAAQEMCRELKGSGVHEGNLDSG